MDSPVLPVCGPAVPPDSVRAARRIADARWDYSKRRDHEVASYLYGVPEGDLGLGR